jgi:hypothetical protein
MKQFEMTKTFFPEKGASCFSEHGAPKWLCEGGLKGSTMDNRWFWNGYVLALKVGETVETDFSIIKRVA